MFSFLSHLLHSTGLIEFSLWFSSSLVSYKFIIIITNSVVFVSCLCVLLCQCARLPRIMTEK